jgi:hypothetical protein
VTVTTVSGYSVPGITGPGGDAVRTADTDAVDVTATIANAAIADGR